MRRSALAAALLLLPLVPHAGAAEEPTFTDPAGDVTFRVGAADQTVPPIPSAGAQNAKTADLVSLHAAETDETLAFTVGLATLAGSAVATVVDVDFAWMDASFRITMSYYRSDAFGGDTRAWAMLLKRADDGWEWAARLSPPTVDASAGTFAVKAPKVYLVTSDGRVPSRGDVVEMMGVTSTGRGVNLPLATSEAYDRMPDAEGEPALLTLERGDFSQGNLIVSSPDRVRVSNGGATTFVFQATIANTGDSEEEYALGVADVPAGWDAKLQTPVRVPPNGERTISVLVSVPFEHEHGGYSSFNLTVQGTRDDTNQARMRMGVLHTPIPQPAGHHQELYLHSRARDLGPYSEAVNAGFPMAWGWMNTQAEHENEGTYVTPETEGDRVEWTAPLNPSLELGLDFDITKTGTLEGSILGKRDADVELRGTLVYSRGRGPEREEVKLADFGSASITLTQQGATPFSLVVTPTEESDYIAHHPEASMFLQLSIDPSATDGIRYASAFDAQLLVDGFVLSLPLNEYHDRLTGVAEAAQSLEIVARGAVEKIGLPGSVLTYPFTLENHGPGGIFTLDLAGNDAQDGILVPRGDISLAQGEERDVTLAVEIPIDANADQEYEVLLFVHAKDDPSQMAIARTKTRATFAADEANADEAGLLLEAQARENDIPAPGLAGLALALALALATSSPTTRSRTPPRQR